MKQLSYYTVEVGDLCQGGIYLLESGKDKLPRNFIYFLNFFWPSFNAIVLEKDIHTNLGVTLSQSNSKVLKTKDFESI